MSHATPSSTTTTALMLSGADANVAPPSPPLPAAGTTSTTRSTSTAIASNESQDAALSSPASIVSSGPNAAPATSSSDSTASDPAADTPANANQSFVQGWIVKIKEEKLTPKKVLKVTVAAFAIFGVVWTTYVSLPNLKLQKWSARNDFLQACLSLDSLSIRSMQCNKSIEAGPVPPPKWKREEQEGRLYLGAVIPNPARLCVAIVLTFGLAVLTVVFFRPRMEPFHPVLSMARATMYGPLGGWRGTNRPNTAGWSPLHFGRRLRINGGEPSGNPTWTLFTEDDQLGQRIGVFYHESDDSPIAVDNDWSVPSCQGRSDAEIDALMMPVPHNEPPSFCLRLSYPKTYSWLVSEMKASRGCRNWKDFTVFHVDDVDMNVSAIEQGKKTAAEHARRMRMLDSFDEDEFQRVVPRTSMAKKESLDNRLVFSTSLMRGAKGSSPIDAVWSTTLLTTAKAIGTKTRAMARRASNHWSLRKSVLQQPFRLKKRAARLPNC